MKKIIFLNILSIIGLIPITMSQSITGAKEVKYRRSSLHTILIESDNFPKKDTIVDAFYKAPFPDKYNDHNIGIKSFNPKDYSVTKAELTEAGLKKSKAGKFAKSMIGLTDDTLAYKVPIIIDKYIKKDKIANKLVAKWYNRQADGSFDVSLIGERGQYDATVIDANIAKGSARGTSILSDAGEELIGKTFVVFSQLNFVKNEVPAAIARDIAKIAASRIPNAILRLAAIKSADIAYEIAKVGYSVWTTAYLYKLKWNDSIQAVFYNDMYFDKKNLDSKKKDAFDNTDLFELEFVGKEKASSLVTFSIKNNKRTEAQILQVATIRNVDAVFEKLQKNYDVFMPKVPLYSGEPITAKIGMKEGLSGGDKFEVLEQVLNPETGLTSYKKVGTIKVDKKLIWDNRYNAADDPENTVAEGQPVINCTTFKGGSNYYPGMLIRQIK